MGKQKKRTKGLGGEGVGKEKQGIDAGKGRAGNHGRGAK